MALRCLWEGSPCQRPVRASVRYRSWTGRLAVRHMGIALEHLWARSPCQRPVRASVRYRSWTGRLAIRHARMALRYLWARSPCRRPSRSPVRHDGMPLMCFCHWSPRRRKVGDRRRDRAVGHIFKSKCYLCHKEYADGDDSSRD